jgi:hypothetical protein
LGLERKRVRGRAVRITSTSFAAIVKLIFRSREAETTLAPKQHREIFTVGLKVQENRAWDDGLRPRTLLLDEFNVWSLLFGTMRWRN